MNARVSGLHSPETDRKHSSSCKWLADCVWSNVETSDHTQCSSETG